ncbi:MAG TPA: hypothetical protein VHY08_02185 [Bacillota bacterium]|nr:hypothetical protein [Bacillota bacterium]
MLKGFVPGVRVYLDYPLGRVYGSVTYGPRGSNTFNIYVRFDNGDLKEFRPGSASLKLLKKVEGQG